jgi:hypothetical protein
MLGGKHMALVRGRIYRAFLFNHNQVMNIFLQDRYKHSRAVFESYYHPALSDKRTDGEYWEERIQSAWIAWCRALDWQAEQQANTNQQEISSRLVDEPQPEWRPLEPGEIIQEGDECKSKDYPENGWSPAEYSIGCTSNECEWCNFRTRRPLPPGPG